jgi:hypothetical protein
VKSMERIDEGSEKTFEMIENSSSAIVFDKVSTGSTQILNLNVENPPPLSGKMAALSHDRKPVLYIIPIKYSTIVSSHTMDVLSKGVSRSKSKGVIMGGYF